MTSPTLFRRGVRAAILVALAVVAMVIARAPAAIAATPTVTLTGGDGARATLTLYSDGFSITDTGGAPWDAVDVADASTGSLIADCWPSYFASFGWNRHCMGVSGGNGWFSFTGATINGLAPNTTYQLTVGFSTNSPHTGAAVILSPDVTTEPASNLLTLSGPPGNPASSAYQVTLTFGTNEIESQVWTLTQKQNGPSGTPIALTVCPRGAALSGGSCQYGLSVAGGGSATLTVQNQRYGGAGYVYSYVASASGSTSNTVMFANAPTAVATTAATAATLSWPVLGNGAQLDVFGNTADNGCGGAGGVASGWLESGTNTAALTGLLPNTSYDFCSEARVPDEPITSGGWQPTWWVSASPTPLWTLAEPPAAVAIGSVGQVGFTLSWNANGNPVGTSYEVDVEAQPSGVVAIDEFATSTSYVASGLSCGTRYDAAVRAENGAGAWTAWVSAASVTTVPCAPSDVTGDDGGLGWSNTAGRGWVTLSWSRVQGASGYRVWIFDGNQYDQIDVGTSTSWDSRIWLGFPSESTIGSQGNNSLCGNPFLSGAQGENLRDDPNELYRKTCGTAYDTAHNYWFRVSAYNASGDSGVDSSAGYFPTLPLQTDTIAPRVSAVTLNSGKTYAYAQSVPIAVTASDGQSGICAIATSPDQVSWTTTAVNGCSVGQVASEPATATYAATVQLAAGPGTKTEYVKVEDTAGNWSSTATATVYVQAAPPPEVSLEIDGGALSTVTTAVTLSLQAADTQYPQGQLQVRLSNDATNWSPWEAFVGATSWTIAGVPGPDTVYVQVQNPEGAIGQGAARINYGGAGNSFGATSNQGTLITYDGVAAWDTPTPLVTAAFVVPTGAVAMQLSLNNITWSQPQAPVASVPATLPTGDGLKAVYAKYSDGSGQAWERGPDYFVLDTTPPTIRSAAWLDNAAATDDGSATLVVQAADNITPSSGLQVMIGGAASWAGTLPDNGQVPLTLSGHGYVAVTVTVTDPAGNRTSTQVGIYN